MNSDNTFQQVAQDIIDGKFFDPNLDPVEEEHCPICNGAGFVHPRADGKPVYSEVVECSCSRDIRLQERYDKIFTNGLYVEYLERKPSDFADWNKCLKCIEKGEGLYIWGEVGRGKTALALECLKWQLTTAKKFGEVFTVPGIINKLRDTVVDDKESFRSLMDRLMTIPMLILDDLSTENDTDFVFEKLFEIVNTRNLRKRELITIVTSNEAPDEFIANVRREHRTAATRIISRLMDKGMCTEVIVKGKDWRNG